MDLNLEKIKENESLPEKVRVLAASKWRQQNLNAWRPIPTFRGAICTFIVLGLVLLGFGILILVLSSNIFEEEIRYDEKCGTQDICQVSFTADEIVSSPIYLYYQLDNFYQNHRNYVISKSREQLNGEYLSVDDIEDDCDPVVKLKDIGYVSPDYGGGLVYSDATKNMVAHPCGLVAKSFFNDTFQLTQSGGTVIPIDETDIAWDSDIKKFENVGNWQEKQWIDVENEHFIVWMRTAGLPNFRKLWGKIDQDLERGKYVINIKNAYPVSYYDGKKYVVLSTTNAFGGKNLLLGGLYIAAGVLSFIAAIAFTIGFYKKQKSN